MQQTPKREKPELSQVADEVVNQGLAAIKRYRNNPARLQQGHPERDFRNLPKHQA